MSKKLKNSILYTIFLVATLSAGCGKDIYYNNITYENNNITMVDDTDSTKVYMIYLVVSRCGLGDNGVQDLIFEGINKAMQEHKSIQLEWVEHNDDKQYAINDLKSWMAESKSPEVRKHIKKRLLILADDKYIDLLKEEPAIRPDDITDILVMETRDSSINGIYTRYISPYGACYLASQILMTYNYWYGKKNCITKLIAPNEQSEYVLDAISGYKKGIIEYKYVTWEAPPTITYLDSENNNDNDIFENKSAGYDNNDAVFDWCLNGFKDSQDFHSTNLMSQDELNQLVVSKPESGADTLLSLIQLAGYSNTGVSQYLRITRNPLGFNSNVISIGMDKEEEDNTADFTVIRRYDLMTYNFVCHWIYGDSQRPYATEFYGTYEELKYHKKTISDNNFNNIADIYFKVTDEPKNKEQEHYNGK